jgi:rieske iron-sulfur protein
MKSNFNKERRDLLKGACTVVGATTLVTLGGSVNAFAAGGAGDYPQPPGAPKAHDTFVYTDGPKKGQDVMTADIVLDAPPIVVQAKDSEAGQVRESEKSTVLIYRVKEETIPVDFRGDSAGGILAYSAMCTHQGCEISDWDASNHLFVCPCHKGTFDPVNGGEPGGGAKRALPQVPVADHDGMLRISHGIIGWIGIKRT